MKISSTYTSLLLDFESEFDFESAAGLSAASKLAPKRALPRQGPVARRRVVQPPPATASDVSRSVLPVEFCALTHSLLQRSFLTELCIACSFCTRNYVVSGLSLRFSLSESPQEQAGEGSPS